MARSKGNGEPRTCAKGGGFVKFWVVRPHAGSVPPLLCHHLECAKCARDVQVHLHGPGGRRLTPGAPPWARAAPGRYQGTMQRNERCGLSGRPTRRREKSGRPAKTRLGRRQGEVHFRRCTRHTSSSCRPRCHRWPCDTATEPQLVRLRRARLCAAMCRTWEGRFSLQVVMTMVGAVGA
jgi:hypothetical protein